MMAFQGCALRKIEGSPVLKLLLKQFSFSKNFLSHLFLSPHPPPKLPIKIKFCYAISLNLNSAVLWHHFPAETRWNQKTTSIIMIVWNANFELKWIKTAKEVPKWPYLASCLPTMKRKSMKGKFLFAKKKKISGRDSMNNDVHSWPPLVYTPCAHMHPLCLH